MKTLSSALLSLVFATALLGCPGPEPVDPPPVGEDAGFDAGVIEPDPDPEPADAGTDGGEPVELKLTRVLPARGGTTGGNYATLEGSGFVQGFAQSPTQAKKVTSISFGGNPAQEFQIISDTLIDVRVPAGLAGPAMVRLENPNGAYNCNGCYRYFEELFVSDAQPRTGPQRGGTTVVLTGTGFTEDTQVLFGQLSSANVTFVSSTEIHVTTPRSSTVGPVDLVAYNQSGVSSMRNGFRYEPELRIASVQPAVGFIPGGESVTILGAGFTGATDLQFGATAVTGFTVVSDSELTAVVPPAASAGAVDVTVSGPRGTWTAREAYTYVAASGPLAVNGVSPRLVDSSPNPGNVTVYGTNFDAPGLAITIEGQPVSIVSSGANWAEVVVPTRVGADPIVDIAVSTNSASAVLPDALTYRLTLTSIIPFEGPQAGGTASRVNGESLPASARVFIGPNEAVGTNFVSESQVDFTTPAGPGGSQDVWVFDANDPENEAIFPGGFIYEEALRIGAVLPRRGAIAGNTLVQVLGAGFREGMSVDFGDSLAKDLKLVNSHLVLVRAPKADRVGPVDVKVRYLAEEDTLEAAYSYFDPKSAYGGSSGGPFVGTLNVTVLESAQQTYGQPVPLARVIVGNDGSTPFQGYTDSRGQVTISDPALVKAPTVTIFKDGFESITVSGVVSENLTVYVGRTGGGGGGGGGGQPAPFSVLQGKVTGFKPPYQLGPSESLVARVWVAQDSVYSGSPWRQPQRIEGLEVYELQSENDEYLLITSPGLRAVYAILGVKDSSQLGPDGSPKFTPYLMGIKRNITADAYDFDRDNRMRGLNITLDMHLNLTVPVTIDGPVSSYGQPAQNIVFSWIDLGAEGVIPNIHNDEMAMNPGTSISMPHHPQLDGSNFIFMNLAYGAPSPGFGGAGAYSIFYRRQPGDLSQGLTLGPLLPLPEIDRPSQATGFNGIVGWKVAQGPTPDIHDVSIQRVDTQPAMSVWSLVMPGYETSATLPPAAVERMRNEHGGAPMSVQVFSSRSPKFSYSQWTYESLSAISWTAFTIAWSEGFTL